LKLTRIVVFKESAKKNTSVALTSATSLLLSTTKLHSSS
jgi:hypothetical protein